MALAPGTRLGPYEITALIGEGGMGVVYRARDTRLDRVVAIKVLHPNVVADAHRRQRFVQEAKAASALNHPNIVTIHDIGRDNIGKDQGVDFIVMEYAGGKTLHEVTRRPGSLKEVLAQAIQIADALATAHAAGIVHRDLKPSNVMVTDDGRVKLVDFGLAKLVEPDASAVPEETADAAPRTRPGAILGTAAYMSPEQAMGRPADARSDVFAFGIVLYEMLAGKRPFAAKSEIDILHAILHDAPRSLHEVRAGIPPELHSIVEKALEKEPAERYQSTRDLVVDLRRAERAKPKSGEPRTAHGRPRTWLWAAVAAAAAAVALAVMVRLPRTDVPSRSWKNPLDGAEFTRLTDFEGSEIDAAISRDGKFVAFRSRHESDTLDAWITQVGSGSFVNLTKGRIRGVPALPSVRTVGFSADGSQVWLVAPAPDLADYHTMLLPAMGGTPRVFLRPGINPTWSPDGSRLAFHEPTRGDPIYVADPNGSNARRIFAQDVGLHSHYLTWSLDARHIYFARGEPSSQNMDIWRLGVADGVVERITQHNSRVAYPTPIDSQTLLYIATAEDGSGSWLYGLDLRDKIPHRVSQGVDQYFSIAAGHPESGRLRLAATVSNPSSSLWTVPITSGIAEETAVRPVAAITSRAAAPQSGPDYLLYLSPIAAASGLWKWNNEGATEIWKASDGGLIGPAAISADGQRICFAIRRKNRIHLFVTNSEGTSPRQVGAALQVRGVPTWSPDTKWIAVAGTDDQGTGLFKIAVDSGEIVRLVKGLALHPKWSPDSGVIVYSEPLQGAILRLGAMTADGTKVPIEPLPVRYEYEAYRFTPGGKHLVVLGGSPGEQDFSLLEIATGRRRTLTRLRAGAMIAAFDVSRDGRQIIFDRIQQNSDILIIDAPRRSSE